MRESLSGEAYVVPFLEFLFGRKEDIPGVLEDVIRTEAPRGSVQGLQGIKGRMAVDTWNDIVELEETDISQGNGDRIALSGLVEGNRVLLNFSPHESTRSNGVTFSVSINNKPISTDDAKEMVELFRNVRMAQAILEDIPAAFVRYREKKAVADKKKKETEAAIRPLEHLIRPKS